MSIRTITAAFCFGLLVLASCKKDDSSDESNYFTGSITVKMPEFVVPGFAKGFSVDTMSTIKRDDDKNVGYYFRNGITAVSDTVRKDGGTTIAPYHLVIPDTTGTFTLTLNAYSDSYYTSSGTARFTVVKEGLGPGCSITGFEVDDTDKTFKDPRDGREYYISTVGNTVWMRQNLAYGKIGKPYRDSKVMGGIMGGYYTWEEAQNACPEGWRLPGDEDWVNLAKECGKTVAAGDDISGITGELMENVYFNGTRLWPFTREVRITNGLRLSFIPAAYATIDDGEYEFLDFTYSNNIIAMLWCSDEAGGMGVCRYFYPDRDVVYRGLLPKNEIAASVRCVKE